jgi:uncharacterized Fe-S radical SAM superfamily protein PflX
MDQYHPDGRVVREPEKFRELGRVITQDEHRGALAIAARLGLRVDRRDPHPRLRRRGMLSVF